MQNVAEHSADLPALRSCARPGYAEQDPQASKENIHSCNTSFPEIDESNTFKEAISKIRNDVVPPTHEQSSKIRSDVRDRSNRDVKAEGRSGVLDAESLNTLYSRIVDAAFAPQSYDQDAVCKDKDRTQQQDHRTEPYNAAPSQFDFYAYEYGSRDFSEHKEADQTFRQNGLCPEAPYVDASPSHGYDPTTYRFSGKYRPSDTAESGGGETYRNIAEFYNVSGSTQKTAQKFRTESKTQAKTEIFDSPVPDSDTRERTYSTASDYHLEDYIRLSKGGADSVYEFRCRSVSTLNSEFMV